MHECTKPEEQFDLRRCDMLCNVCRCQFLFDFLFVWLVFAGNQLGCPLGTVKLILMVVVE